MNNRLSHLCANISLIRYNLCPVSFINVPERAYVEGSLGLYKPANIDLPLDVLVWADERSCQRCGAIRAIAAEPNSALLRLREDSTSDPYIFMERLPYGFDVQLLRRTHSPRWHFWE